MDVSNTTGEETKYRVTSGGTPPGDKEDEKEKKASPGNRAQICVTRWKKLKQSDCFKHAPVPPSPWMIEFQVGDQTVVGIADQPTDQVKLVRVRGKYRVEISREAKPAPKPKPKPKATKAAPKARAKSKSAA